MQYKKSWIEIKIINQIPKIEKTNFQEVNLTKANLKTAGLFETNLSASQITNTVLLNAFY
jgi:uncharacterized protein YjbI with pentapeptide repeats